MRRITFRDRDNIEIPTASEISGLKTEQLRETAIALSYALQHGSGATVRLAFPFAYCVAGLVKSDKTQDVQQLIQSLEEEGRSAGFGSAMVEWD